MFREMRRARQKLSEAECIRILERGSHGVLALLGDDGYPYSVPLSYLYADGRIIFHGAGSGHKLDAMRGCPKASFCVVDTDDIISEIYTTAYRSVIAFGQMRVLESTEEKLQAAVALGEKYRPGHIADAEKEAADAMEALCIFVLDIEYMSGKQGKELSKDSGSMPCAE